MCYGSFDAASMRIMAARYARPITPARAPETPVIRARTVAKTVMSANTRAVKIVTPLGALTFYQRPTPVRAIEQDIDMEGIAVRVLNRAFALAA